jgi:hypothetical protein
MAVQWIPPFNVFKADSEWQVTRLSDKSAAVRRYTNCSLRALLECDHHHAAQP